MDTVITPSPFSGSRWKSSLISEGLICQTWKMREDDHCKQPTHLFWFDTDATWLSCELIILTVKCPPLDVNSRVTTNEELTPYFLMSITY